MQPHPVSLPRLAALLDNLGNTSVMVVGDVMLDEYLWGDATRISPEAPVPVVSVDSSSVKLGGGANVAWNLAALGAKPHLISVCGTDFNGERLRQLCTELAINCDGLRGLPDRPTTHKTRIIARHQQVVRADRESTAPLQPHQHKELRECIAAQIDSVKGIILSDYGKGVLTADLIAFCIAQAAKRGIFVAVDPKNRLFSDYRGAGVITPNLKEAWQAARNTTTNYSDNALEQVGWQLVEEGSLQTLLITMGERGMALFDRSDRSFFHLQTVARKVFDVTGAGDTVISAYTAAVTTGASPREAMVIANQAAGITVGEPGTAAVTTQQLRESFDIASL